MDKFERSIQDFYNHERLEYLDLAFLKPEKYTVKGIEFWCFSPKFKHEFHSENKQLNLISDLQLLAIYRTENILDQIKILSRVSLKYFHQFEETQIRLNNLLEKQNKNLKNQKFEHLEGLIQSIFDKPKQIEQRSLDLVEKLDQRINKLEDLVNKLIQHII
ncbi:hypothetical protein [Black pepper virus B]|nr:hypothetical protein [Black pepper virus B]